MLGLAWIGLAFAHAVLLRDLDHGGGLVFAVLLGTFVGDTGAYLGGRAFGRRRLAPTISPNKTVEGLAIGIVIGDRRGLVGRALARRGWAARNGAILGVAIAIAAPIGDLFESYLKRDAGHQGHRHALRRPRRRAGPPRRRDVHRGHGATTCGPP